MQKIQQIAIHERPANEFAPNETAVTQNLEQTSASTSQIWMNEWMNEKKIYIARLKAYKRMLNLPRLAEN